MSQMIGSASARIRKHQRMPKAVRELPYATGEDPDRRLGSSRLPGHTAKCSRASTPTSTRC